jgi:hypothetical protein
MPKKHNVPDVPWITAEGYFDVTKFPIEPMMLQALSDDPEDVRSALQILASMARRDRREAGVFLLGLLAEAGPDDLRARERIVEALSQYRSASSAAALFAELRRVKSSNATRQYIDALIKALRRFPEALAAGGFDELAADPAFSYRMRAKFREAAKTVRWEEPHRTAVQALFEGCEKPAGRK